MTSYYFWTSQANRWSKCIDEGSLTTAKNMRNNMIEKTLNFKGFYAGPGHSSMNAASIRKHNNYSGSGAKAFGGVKEWPVLDVHAAFPADVENEKLEEVIKDFTKVLKKHGFF